MPTEPENLSRKQEAFIAALLMTPTIREAAAACKINEATARRWLQLPAVQQEYRQARRQVVEQAQTVLEAAIMEAIEALRRNMTTAAPPGVQVRAALGVLEQVNQMTALDEIQQRLEQLEALVATLEPQKGRELHAI